MKTKKIYRPDGYGIVSNVLTRVFGDFERNYLPENKKSVGEKLSSDELGILVKNPEFLERIDDEKFAQYAQMLCVRSLEQEDFVERKLLFQKIPKTSPLSSYIGAYYSIT